MQVRQEAGATGLEPATSGVTGPNPRRRRSATSHHEWAQVQRLFSRRNSCSAWLRRSSSRRLGHEWATTAHGPLTYHVPPSATGRKPWQRFWPVPAASAPIGFAAECHRLRPRSAGCSWKTPRLPFSTTSPPPPDAWLARAIWPRDGLQDHQRSTFVDGASWHIVRKPGGASISARPRSFLG